MIRFWPRLDLSTTACNSRYCPTCFAASLLIDLWHICVLAKWRKTTSVTPSHLDHVRICHRDALEGWLLRCSSPCQALIWTLHQVARTCLWPLRGSVQSHFMRKWICNWFNLRNCNYYMGKDLASNYVIKPAPKRSKLKSVLWRYCYYHSQANSAYSDCRYDFYNFGSYAADLACLSTSYGPHFHPKNHSCFLILFLWRFRLAMVERSHTKYRPALGAQVI